ncbi:hypothetical protein BACSP_00679 [Bacillus sp. T2.9-1]|nr:hypothetical protein BACSP_00679 [Bacillus sp. T2.9-1]
MDSEFRILIIRRGSRWETFTAFIYVRVDSKDISKLKK